MRKSRIEWATIRTAQSILPGIVCGKKTPQNVWVVVSVLIACHPDCVEISNSKLSAHNRWQKLRSLTKFQSNNVWEVTKLCLCQIIWSMSKLGSLHKRTHHTPNVDAIFM